MKENNIKRMKPSERKDLILKAAEELFFEKGFSETSLDTIVEKAGGSKRNIYTEFGSKENLFYCLIKQKTDSVFKELSAEKIHTKNLENVLSIFAHNLMNALLQPEVLNIYRLMMTNGSKFPEIAEIFYKTGSKRGVTVLAESLKAFKDNGEISANSLEMSADHFMGMLRGSNLYLQVLLNLRQKPKKKELDTFIDSVICTFLKGIK